MVKETVGMGISGNPELQSGYVHPQSKPFLSSVINVGVVKKTEKEPFVFVLKMTVEEYSLPCALGITSLQSFVPLPVIVKYTDYNVIEAIQLHCLYSITE